VQKARAPPEGSSGEKQTNAGSIPERPRGLEWDAVRRLYLPLTLLALLTFSAGLGRGAMTDADEAFYAEAAREMVASGDYVTPFFNYEYRFQKPILYYWMTALVYQVTGPTEAAARLGAALSGIGLVLITAACARRWRDHDHALLAGAMVATAFGCYSIGRMALPDLPLAFFITLATWAGLTGTLRLGTSPRAWLLVSALAMALGFLTKGPVAVILPALVVVPVTLIERRGLGLTLTDLLLGTVVFAVVGLPWYGLMWERHGTAYLHSFFLGDNLERFATDRFNDPRPWWFYLPVVFGGLLPWSPLMGTWWPALRDTLHGRRRPSAATLRLVIWATVPLLFYSLSIGKQPRYVLPVLPPLAMLLADGVRRALTVPPSVTTSTRGPVSLVAGGAVTGVVLAIIGVLIWRAKPLLIHVSDTTTLLASVSLSLAGVLVLVVSASRWWRGLPLALTFAGTVCVLALQFGPLASAGDSAVEQVARDIARQHTPAHVVGTHQVFVRNLVFYAHVATRDLPNDDALAAFFAGDGPRLLVTTAERLPAVQALAGAPLTTRLTVSYFNEAGIRLRTLLSPDPTRDLTQVVVVERR
jgi:4-amino-4-deoxy-L-arabinose transferase-like glycosyltransferase